MPPLGLMTSHERSLLAYADRLLGRQLSRLLLAGQGDKYGEEKRTFLLTLKGPHAGPSERRIITFTSATQVLPHGADPLVLAGILHLLTPGCTVLDQVTFETRELLELLGWPHDPKTMLVIAKSIKRCVSVLYESCVIYQRHDGKTKRRVREMCSVFSGYSCYSDTELGSAASTSAQHVVGLLSTLAESLRRGQSVFMGVDFKRVADVQCLPTAPRKRTASVS